MRASDTDGAFRARAKLRRLFETDLIEQIGHAFDAVAPAGIVMRLPRIELSVRVADLDALADAIAAGIREQADRWPVEMAERADASAVVAEEAGSAPQQTLASLDALVTLIQYLETGLLSWSAASLDREQTRAMLAAAALRDPGRVLARVPHSLPAAIAFVFRWLQLLSETEWPDLARHLEEPRASTRGIADAVAAIVTPVSVLATPARHHVAAIVMAMASLRRSGIRVSAQDVTPMLSAAAIPASGVDSVSEPSPGILPPPVREWVRHQLARHTKVASRATPPSHRAIEGPPAAIESGAVAAEPRTSPDIAPVAIPAPREDQATAGEAAGVSVPHAGLVLLHPFLPFFFERTGIIRNGEKTIDRAVLPRAAALLSFAARGEDDPVEFELGFIKLLLGLRPEEELLVPAGLLSTTDRDEVDALLASVIEHWKVLKHSSIAGLRGAFLQRRGLLTEIDGSWRLRVEPDSFDMLIDRLPWGLGTVKLPWMTTLLFTEWARS